MLKFAVVAVTPLLAVQVANAECPGGLPCTNPDDVQALVAYVQRYGDALAAGQLVEAEALGKKVVELTIDTKGRESISTAYALTNLAFVQQQSEAYVAALQNYQAAIDIIEHADGVLSADLIRPVQGIGETQLAMGEAEAAKRTFERALHVSHVNSGPLNTDQVRLLNTITVVDVSLGDVAGALDTQKNVLGLQTRGVDPSSADMLPALQHHADWMGRLKLFNRERNTFWQILDIQEDQFGKKDLSLVPTLIALAGPAAPSRQSQIDQSSVRPDPNAIYASGTEYEYLTGLDDRRVVRSATPDYYMRRAFEIATEHPESNWEFATATALTIGDYWSVVRRLNPAKLAYVDAWHRLSESPEGRAIRRQELEIPNLLFKRWLPKYYENEKPISNPGDGNEFQQGTITAMYDVSKLGKTVNIRVMESRPANLEKVEKELVERLEDSIHRPRMADGTMVDTYDLTFVYDFFYRSVED